MAEMTQTTGHFDEIRVKRSPSDKKGDHLADTTEHKCPAKHKGFDKR